MQEHDELQEHDEPFDETREPATATATAADTDQHWPERLTAARQSNATGRPQDAINTILDLLESLVKT